MTTLILVPLFIIGAIVIASRVAKWIGQGIEAAIGVGVGLCAIFAAFVIVMYAAKHLGGGSTSARSIPVSSTVAVSPTPTTPAQVVPTVPTVPVPGVSNRSATAPTPIPSPRETIPASVPTTVPPDPALQAGFGSLWINVCGSSSKGYRMCKGSRPTAEQVAACFPADACGTASTVNRSRAIPA